MRFLSFLTTVFITLPLTLFALSFALSNSLPVGVNLWPFTFAAMPSPSLGVLGVVLLGSGFFLGAVFVGLWSQHWRYRAWQQQRRAERAERDLAAFEKKQQEHRDQIAAEIAGLQEDKPALRLADYRANRTGVNPPGTQSALRDTESSPFRFF